MPGMVFARPVSDLDRHAAIQGIRACEPERVGWSMADIEAEIRAKRLNLMLVWEHGRAAPLCMFAYTVDFTRRGNETVYIEWFHAFEPADKWLGAFLLQLKRWIEEAPNKAKHLAFYGRLGFARKYASEFRKAGLTSRHRLFWGNLEQRT